MARDVQITVDCADPASLAAFWAEALGYRLQDPPEGFATWEQALEAMGVPPESRNDASAVVDPAKSGPRLFFQRVPEGKQVKNRVHLDLEPSDRTRDDEIERVISLGATPFDDLRRPDGTGWMVLQDPEGNEFCILRSAAERERTLDAD